MKRLLLILLVCSTSAWSQIALPIQQSVLPKNSLVVNYDFSKSASFTRGGSTVTNIAGTASGNASVVNSPNFFNSLGFVSLNGTNQYVITPNLRTYFKSVNSTVQKSFTLSLWFYPTTLNGIIVSELEAQVPDPGTGYQYSNIEIVNGVIKYRVNAGSPVSSIQTVALNQWYHVAMVYNGTTLKGYVNGVLQGSQIYDRGVPTSSQNYGIGAGDRTHMGSGGGYGAFNLAQFKLHHLPLTDSDILQEYNLRKDELDYLIHSPSTNANPTYWTISSVWNSETTFSQDHFTPWLNNTRLGWAALYNDVNQWITLNYDEPAYIKGVVIQPRVNSWNQFVTKVHVETSMTGAAPWTRIVSDVPISTTITDDGRVLFPTSIFAKSVRVIPVTWINHITMRMGMLVKPNNPVTDGLVLNLDAANIKSYQGTGTTWTDLSSSSNNATISLSPTHNAATGLTFNGSTQHGTIPSVDGVTNFTNTQQYTIEAWFNPGSGEENPNESQVVEKWNTSFSPGRYPYTIRFRESTGLVTVALYDGSKNPGISITGFSVNTWVQIVAVFDFGVSKTLTVYRNGVSAGSTSLSGVNQVSNTSFVSVAGRVAIGQGSADNKFKGSIGIIRMYNKALTASEVLQNFNTFKLRYGL